MDQILVIAGYSLMIGVTFRAGWCFFDAITEVLTKGLEQLIDSTAK